MSTSRGGAEKQDTAHMLVTRTTKNIGVVVIGRNEGERLKRCIRAIAPEARPTVYVDSGSSDDSVIFCKASGVAVIELDLRYPFTAARARNEGFRHLMALHPAISYVQFVDGDCQLHADWLDYATSFLDNNPAYAAVCGRRREIHPEASVYNRLCDIEWDTPIGDAQACGGDVLIRSKALQEVDGYCDQLIAGEEPELCFRLRARGWKIMRAAAEMTLHDAQITRFGQWWRRSKRAGYACAMGVLMHGNSPEKYFVKPLQSMVLWGGLLPLSIIVLAAFKPALAIFFLIYPLQYLRLGLKGPGAFSLNMMWAQFIVLGKFSEFTGVVQCLGDYFGKKSSAIIEYK